MASGGNRSGYTVEGVGVGRVGCVEVLVEGVGVLVLVGRVVVLVGGVEVLVRGAGFRYESKCVQTKAVASSLVMTSHRPSDATMRNNGARPSERRSE